MRLVPGEVFSNQFTLIEPRGRGGTGEVWLVEQRSTGRQRALKILSDVVVQDDIAMRRFETEARVGSIFQSPHLVEVLAAGVDIDHGRPWLLMELLDGETLDHVIEREGPPKVGAAYVLMSALGSVLGAAHAAGVVHRDVKPGNMFIEARSSGPFLRLLDFGVAKVVRSGKTLTGEVGTPSWMAPEQVDRSFDVPPATDVWAFGLVAFYVLTGRRYWRGKGFDVLLEIAREPYPSASERAEELGVVGVLPIGFDAWFSRCVAHDVTQRFIDADAAWRELGPMLRAHAARTSLGSMNSPDASGRELSSSGEHRFLAPPSSTVTSSMPLHPVAPSSSSSADLPAAPPSLMPPNPTAPLSTTPAPQTLPFAVRPTPRAKREKLPLGIIAAVAGVALVIGFGAALGWVALQRPEETKTEARNKLGRGRADRSSRDPTPRESSSSEAEFLRLPLLPPEPVFERLRDAGFVVRENLDHQFQIYGGSFDRGGCTGFVSIHGFSESAQLDGMVARHLEQRVRHQIVTQEGRSLVSILAVRTEDSASPDCAPEAILELALGRPPGKIIAASLPTPPK